MQDCKQTTLLESPLSGSEKPDFALYCTSEESVSAWAVGYFLPLKSLFKFPKDSCCSVTFNLSKPEMLVSGTDTGKYNFFHRFSTAGVGYFVSGGVGYGVRQDAPGKKIHFGIFAKPHYLAFLLLPNLMITCKQDSTHCGGSFSNSPVSLSLKSKQKNQV